MCNGHIFLFSCFYFTAKSQRLREERNGLSLQRIAVFDWLKTLNLFGLVGILNSLMFKFWSTRLHNVCTKFHHFFLVFFRHEDMKTLRFRFVSHSHSHSHSLFITDISFIKKRSSYLKSVISVLYQCYILGDG